MFVRFGSLYAGKIGALTGRTLLYLCEKDHDVQPHNTFDIFQDGYGENLYVCNYQLLKMWKRVFSTRKRVFLLDGIAKYFFTFCNRFLIRTDHIIATTRGEHDVLNLIGKSIIYLKFTEEEVSRAESEMKRMDIARNDSYVCMLNRSQDYLEKTFPLANCDHNSFRSCSIDNYMPAAEEMTKRGHHVIRMGSIVGDLMNTDNPKIIEYAHWGYRTELLDIYLSAHCYFFISCGSGLDEVPWAFKKPVVYVNFHHLEYINSFSPNFITIFRKHWLEKENRFMSVQEIIESGAGRCQTTEQYEDMGIKLIENTPEEIIDVVDEMDKRLKGIWQTTEEDEERQSHFWSFFKSSDLHGVINARVGAKFLRQNLIFENESHAKTS